MTRYLDPTNDFTFKRVFCDKNRLINFLNAIMRLPKGFRIVALKYISQERVPELGHRKSGLLDIKCRDESDNVFIVEMQNGYEQHLLKRLQYYSSTAYVAQLRKGDSYGDLDPVFVIVILRDQIISPDIPVISYHKSMEVSTGVHIFQDIVHVLVELPKFTKSEEALQNEEDHWLYFLSRWSVAKRPPKTLKDPIILEAYEQIEQYNLSEDEYKLYLDAKTLAEKEAYNLEFEYSKGKKEGREEGILETAKNLIKQGISLDIIAKATGLSEEELAQLA